MTRFSLRYPHPIIVLCLCICVDGVACMARMPVDRFPDMNIPAVMVATIFSGMPPGEIENYDTARFERFVTLGSGIDHLQSCSLPGVSLIKVDFQPVTDSETAVNPISSLASANLRRLPPGTLPPVVLKFDDSSLPVCLITHKGERLDETRRLDLGQFDLLNQVADVPGASVPQSFTGCLRQIVVYVDPLKPEANQLSVMDEVRVVDDSCVILPASDERIEPYDNNICANGQLSDIEDINRLPLKTGGNAWVLVGDIDVARFARLIQANAPGDRLSVLKFKVNREYASSLDHTAKGYGTGASSTSILWISQRL